MFRKDRISVSSGEWLNRDTPQWEDEQERRCVVYLYAFDGIAGVIGETWRLWGDKVAGGDVVDIRAIGENNRREDTGRLEIVDSKVIASLRRRRLTKGHLAGLSALEAVASGVWYRSPLANELAMLERYSLSLPR